MYPAHEAAIAVRFVDVGHGVRVRTLQSGDATGRAVLLVHGWGASVYSWAETIPALAAAGFHVIALDLPGHGLSDKPTTDEHYTTSALTRAVLCVADAYGLVRFSFVGHSLGGSLGLDLAVRGDRHLDRLALISAVGLASSPFIPPLRLFSPRIVNRITPLLLTRSVLTVVLHSAFATSGRPNRRDIDEYWAPSQFPEYAWACRACVHKATWSAQPTERLRSLQLPVLVLAGRHDRLVRGTVERGRVIPNVRVLSVRDAGHLVQQEAPDITNRELIEFLRSA
jgi:pimeloyl-ACP methyl ester carboxylesterase